MSSIPTIRRCVPQVPDLDRTVFTASDQPFTLTMEANGSDIAGMAVKLELLSVSDLRRVAGKTQRALTGGAEGFAISYMHTFL